MHFYLLMHPIRPAVQWHKHMCTSNILSCTLCKIYMAMSVAFRFIDKEKNNEDRLRFSIDEWLTVSISLYCNVADNK